MSNELMEKDKQESSKRFCNLNLDVDDEKHRCSGQKMWIFFLPHSTCSLRKQHYACPFVGCPPFHSLGGILCHLMRAHSNTQLKTIGIDKKTVAFWCNVQRLKFDDELMDKICHQKACRELTSKQNMHPKNHAVTTSPAEKYSGENADFSIFCKAIHYIHVKNYLVKIQAEIPDQNQTGNRFQDQDLKPVPEILNNNNIKQ